MKRPLFKVMRANREKAQQRASARRYRDEWEKVLADAREDWPKGFAWWVLGLIVGKEKK